LVCATVVGQEGGINDNSFLIEEAYNQEQGVVQHIFRWVPSWDGRNGHKFAFDVVFEQEWPVFGQKNQFSFTLPMLYQYERGHGEPGVEAQGFGDLSLNYRRQVLGGGKGELSFAPRLSIILPTGDSDRRLGNGVVGYQVALPFSKEFDCWAIHANLGATWTPGVRSSTDVSPWLTHDLEGYYAGSSVIYFARPNFHLMLETLALWDEEVAAGQRHSVTQWFLNPGCRWAPFTEGETQWVVGISTPIGLTRDTPEIGLLLYMSFEHRFARQR
jgi:hypothetical protein